MGRFWNWLRATEPQGANWLAFTDLLSAPTYAGVAVTQENATNLPAVFRCVSLNGDTVSTLPVDCMAKRNNARVEYPAPFWLTAPNARQDWGQFLMQVQLSLELDGNAFILKAVDGNGRLAALHVLAPSAVVVEQLVTGEVVYQVTTVDGQETLSSTEIMHIPWVVLPGTLRGLSPISAAQQTIGTALAAERFGAQFFGSGATMSGIVSVPGAMTEDAAERLSDSMKRKHGGISKSHAVGILTGGATWIPLSVNPEESQFLETRKFTDTQIANLFGIPPVYVTDAEGAKGYVTGLYAQQYMWLQTGLNPRLTRLERAFSSLLPRPAYIKFNRNAFLAMDPTERSAFYAAGLQGRWLVPNEIRGKEDMNPLPGGNDPLWSVQWNGAGNKFPEPPEPPPPPTPEPAPDEAAQSGLSSAPNEGGTP